VSEGVEAAAVESIVAATLRDHRAIAREMTARIVGEVDAYAHASDPQELRLEAEESCDAHIQSFLRSVARQLEPEELEIDFTVESVVRRVRQDIPLESVLHAYRIGHRVLWAALEDRAAAGNPRAVIALVAPSIRYIDAVSTMVAEVYLREQQHALADSDRARRDVLELLLAGNDGALPAAEASGIALDPDASHQVLIGRSEMGGQVALRRICSEIASIFARDAPLVVIRQQLAVALVRGDQRITLSRAKRLAARFATSEQVRVGVSLATDDLVRGMDEAYGQAERALQATGEADPVVGLGGLAAIDYLIAAADESARALVPSEVTQLARSSLPADVALIRTFNAYLANGLNVQRTAAALPAHANTVHGRLRRLTARTGYDLRDQRDIFRLFVDLQLAGARPRRAERT
jgi:sugar diacid utilization regulator